MCLVMMRHSGLRSPDSNHPMLCCVCAAAQHRRSGGGGGTTSPCVWAGPIGSLSFAFPAVGCSRDHHHHHLLLLLLLLLPNHAARNMPACHSIFDSFNLLKAFNLITTDLLPLQLLLSPPTTSRRYARLFLSPLPPRRCDCHFMRVTRNAAAQTESFTRGDFGGGDELCI